MLVMLSECSSCEGKRVECLLAKSVCYVGKGVLSWVGCIRKNVYEM